MLWERRGKAGIGQMVFDSTAFTALSLALPFGIRDWCQLSTLHTWACSHLQDCSNLTSPNSKHQRLSNEKIYFTVTNKKRTMLGHKGWKKRWTFSCRPYHTSQIWGLLYETVGDKVGRHTMRWKRRREMETCCVPHPLCVIETDSNPLTWCKQWTERRWTVSMACREWASCHKALTVQAGERKGGMEEEKRYNR